MDDYIRDLRRAYDLLTSGEDKRGLDLLEGTIGDMEREERERIPETMARL